MIWLFEKDTFDEGNPERMKAIAESMGHQTHWVNYIPFGVGLEDEIIEKIGLSYLKNPLIVYGSLGLAGHIHETRVYWKPGVWCDQSKLTCQYYYGAIGRYCLNNEYIMFPLKEAKRLEDFLFSALTRNQYPNNTRKIFIRPDQNNKIFAGSVVASNNFDEWIKQANFYVENETVLAVAAPVHNIVDEWRTVVWNGKVVAASKYKENNKSVRIEDMNSEVIDYVEHVIKETGFQPHPVMCFDACRLDTGVIRILEIGSVNAAGLYACNLEAVVDSMSRQAIIDHGTKNL